MPARFQELRMLLGVPRALRRLRPALAHFQHSVPLRWRGPMVVTVHDLSFERTATAMGRRDRAIFKVVVPWSVRRTRHGDRRLRADEARPDRPVPRARGADHRDAARDRPRRLSAPRRAAERGARTTTCSSSARSRSARTRSRRSKLRRRSACRWSSPGPEREPALARELERRGADLRGYVEKAELAALYRGAAVLVLPSRYEGFGLPVLEAMACGTPVVANPDPGAEGGRRRRGALRGARPIWPRRSAAAIAERGRLVAAGFARATGFSWDETARLTLDAYRKALA